MFIILGGGGVNVALLWSELVGSSEATELFFPSHLLTTKKERTAIQTSQATKQIHLRKGDQKPFRIENRGLR